MKQKRYQRAYIFLPIMLAGLIILLLGITIVPQQAKAAASLTVTIDTAYNLVVDSNVSSPSTYAPRAATVYGTFCNDGTDPMTDVFGSIGNYDGGGNPTPGTYPALDTEAVDFATNYPDWAYLTGTGSYAFTHIGGGADATRFIGDLAPGECKVQYWHFTYPACANEADGTPVEPPCTTTPTWGPSVKPEDDLSLSFDIWGTGKEGLTTLTDNQRWTMTMRNEISAMANKIKPNPSGHWFNTDTSTIAPGAVITTNGVLYTLGNVNQGFDNDIDFTPDYNAWLQPFGDPSYDPSCFRLIRSSTILTVSRSAGQQDLILNVDDLNPDPTYGGPLYFTNLPSDNNGVDGEVRYTFLALDGPCSVPVSPYQEVASGSDNEKFNGDYGVGVPPIVSTEPEVTIEKNGDTVVAQPGTVTYNIPVVNTGSLDAGLTLSSGWGVNTPLVISDTIPAGLVYVATSADLTGDVSATVLFYNTATSVWESVEPAAANVGAIQWWLAEPLPANGGAVNATFQAAVPVSYAGSSFITNEACTSFGSGVSFACDDTVTMVEGNSTIGDYVWEDLNTNGVQDIGEAGIDGVPVYLYWDSNGNGLLDDGDVLIDSQETSGGGAYDFTLLPNGNYIVTVDGNDADIPLGYNYTTPKIHPVSITTVGTNYDDADFGFGPILNLTKSLTTGNPAYEDQLVRYAINVINTRPGSTSDNKCEYIIPTGLGQNTGTGGTVWTDPASAEGIPDNVYAIATLASQPQTMEMMEFASGSQGAIDNVELILYVKEVTELSAGDLLNVEVLTGTTTTIAGPTDYTGAGFFTDTVGTEYEIVIDTWGGYTWGWSDFGATSQINVQLSAEKGGGAGGAQIGVDAAVFVVTTNDSCGDSNDILDPVPLTDTYDSTKLMFVSANPPVSSSSPGTLTWNNVGPLVAGQTKPVEVTFRALAPAPSGEIITNTATISNAKYLNGRDANDVEDDAVTTLVETGSIGDRVWFDTDGDGNQEAGEPGIPGVVLQLTADSDVVYNGVNYVAGSVVMTITTNANGNYLFDGLPLDIDYTVTILDGADTVLDGANQTAEPPGNGCSGQCGPTGTATPTSATPDIDNIDYGYDAQALIYGSVWHDDNRDASDVGEQYLAGIEVQLCADSGGVSCSQTTTTDENGQFSFGVTPPNNGTDTYYVVVTSPGTQVAGPTGAGTKDTCITAGGTATCNDASPVISVGSSGGVLGSYDFGYDGAADIGNTIYQDWNGDGTQDTGEEGVENVRVLLYRDTDGNGVYSIGDVVVSEVTTDASGLYTFTEQLDGDYVVFVDTSTLPNGYSQTGDPDEGLVTCSTCDNQSSVTVANQQDELDEDFGYQPRGTGAIGDFVWNDADGDGYQDPSELGISDITVTLYEDENGNGVIDAEDAVISTTVTAPDGTYLFPDLPVGSFLVDVDTTDSNLPTDGNGNPYVLSTENDPHPVTLTAGQTYLDADFGFTAGGAIGDYIWSDNNGDGVQDNGEPPLSGVVVELRDGVCIPSTDCPIVTTDANGLYQFTGLISDTYTVVVVSGVPAGFTQTGDPDATGSCTTDPQNACDNASTIHLPHGQINMSRDFGYQPAVVIGDFVWLDQNDDGVQDAGEPGIGGVVITLTLQGGAVFTTTTDSDGYYTFGAVPNGTHLVEVDTNSLPAGLTPTYEYDGNTTNPDGSTSVTIAGASNLDLDFGYKLDGNYTFSGTVFYDVDESGGDQGVGEPGYDGQVVYLWRQFGSQYVQVGTTVTDANGDYSFTGLSAGDYVASTEANAPVLNNAAHTTTPSFNDDTAYEYQTITTANIIDVDFGFFIPTDFGDLPTVYNVTKLNDVGPFHTAPVADAIRLGPAVTFENDGTESDTAAADADDGVMLDSSILWDGSNTVYMTVTVSGTGLGDLGVWLDLNADDDFDDPGEFFSFASLGAGDHYLPFGNIDAINTVINARFRLFDENGIPGGSLDLADYTGGADNGEVEDYQWEFGPTAVNLQSFSANNNVASPVGLVIVLSLILMAGSFIIIRHRKVTE